MQGKLRVEGSEECRFWVRAFKLEQWVEHATRKIMDGEKGKYASVPVVSEYVVNERMGFYYFLVLEVDALGVEGGEGVIWISGLEGKEQALAARDKLADDVLAQFRAKKPFDEMMEIEPGRE